MSRRPLRLRAARWAGIAVRVLRAPARGLPGLLGALLVAVGLGQVAGHIWHRGLTWWVAAAIGGMFLLLIGRELNSAPPAPRRDDGD